MSKKILSLALAVVMLMSIFAISANAAVASGKTVGFVVESTAEVGMKAGDTVTVSVYYDAPAATTLSYGNISLAYNDAAYTLDVDSFEWDPFFADFFKKQTSTVSQSAAAVTGTTGIVTLLNSNDAANGWNNGVQIQQAYINGATYGTTTGFPIDAGKTLIFKINFTVAKDLTAADVIGVPEGPYGKRVFVRDFTTGKAVLLDAAAVDFSEAVAAPAAAATPTVEFVKAQSRWAGGVAGQDYEYGFVGKLINFTPTSTSTGPNGNPEVDNISSISATISVDGTAKTAYVHTIWQGADGAYYFRASVSGFAYTDTNAIDSVVFTVATADGNLVSVSPAATTVNAIYAASVAAGLSAAA